MRSQLIKRVALPLLVSGALAVGCTEQTVVPDNGPPAGHFTMTVFRDSSYCPLSMRFRLDASQTKDDATGQEDLEMRWDLQDNGLWDTSYFGFKPYRWMSPDPSWDTWVVRLGVRDLVGNESEYVDSMDLGFLPTEPDLIMGWLEVRQTASSFASPDTIVVGEPFDIGMAHSCFGDIFSRVAYTVTVYVDGMTVDVLDEPCESYWNSCSFYIVRDVRVDAPGPHEVRVVLDVDNRISETDESNNVAVLSLTSVE